MQQINADDKNSTSCVLSACGWWLVQSGLRLPVCCHTVCNLLHSEEAQQCLIQSSELALWRQENWPSCWAMRHRFQKEISDSGSVVTQYMLELCVFSSRLHSLYADNMYLVMCIWVMRRHDKCSFIACRASSNMQVTWCGFVYTIVRIKAAWKAQKHSDLQCPITLSSTACSWPHCIA